MHIDQARRLRVPLDWALELGILAEAWKNCAPRAICQAELCDNYEHKHQTLSPRNPSRGLHKVAREVALAFLRLMSAEGAPIDSGLLDTLLVAYQRHAEDALRLHAADALINGLQFPRHDEALAVTTFVRAIREAGRAFLADPLHSPLTPGWDRVHAAMPDFLPRLRHAVEADNAVA
jgi:glucosyl-3-phosphoglycerate synthase